MPTNINYEVFHMLYFISHCNYFLVKKKNGVDRDNLLNENTQESIVCSYCAISQQCGNSTQLQSLLEIIIWILPTGA